MTAPVLIAQISDLHIKRPGERAYEMVDTAAALTHCIAHLNRFRPRPAFVVISGDLVLLLLDSSVPGKDDGRLDSETLQWLDGELAAAPDRPALVFMHHPPFKTGIAHMDRQNLRNAAQLAAILERHAQVQLIAAGHVHRAVT